MTPTHSPISRPKRISSPWYNRQSVLRDLRSFAGHVGRPPREIDLGQRNKLPSYPVIKRLWGSWSGCLLALGYSPKTNRHWAKYDNPQAVQLFKQFVERKGRPPKLNELGRKNRLPSWPVVKRLFGGLNGYRIAIGYPARWAHKKWTKRELTQIIRMIYSEVKRPPTLLDLQARTKEGLPNQHTFTRVFGSWDSAVRAAGFDLDEHQLFWRRWQRLVVKAVIALYGRNDVVTGRVTGITGSVDCYVKSRRLVIDAMTSGYEHAYKAGEIPRYTTGARRLEFWCAHRGVREYRAPRLDYRYAAEIATMLTRKGYMSLAKHVRNFAKGEAALYTDDFLFKLVRQLAKRLRRTPRLKDFDNDPEMPSGALIFRRFGSLEHACKKAGVSYVPSLYSQRYSKKQLLACLRHAWLRLQRAPTVYDFGSSKGRPSVRALARAFGTWNRALQAAGIPLSRPRYSKEELVFLYRRVIKAVRGQPPSSKEWDRLRQQRQFHAWSLPSSRTMIQRTGGWGKLKVTAGCPYEGKGDT